MAALALVALGADATKPPIEMIIDPEWKAVPGERAEVTAGSAPACRTYLAYNQYRKFTAASDSVGIERLRNGKLVESLPKGTPARIIRSYRPERPREVAVSGLSSDAFMRSRQNDILNSRKDAEVYPVEVRILEGPLKDQLRFLPEDSISRLIPRPEPRGFFVRRPGEDSFSSEPFVRPKLEAARRPGSRTSDESVRASNTLRAGRRLEKHGDLISAVGAYWFVTRDYPESAAAKSASNRLKALGFERTPDGSYRLDLARPSKKK